MAEVVLEGVEKTYPGGIRAVDGLSLTISSGELLALVGPSGSGKTTALRLLAGLETPTRGLLRIAGRVVNQLPPHRRDVALVFQRPALYPHLTVRQNLAFGLELRHGNWFLGLSRGDRKAIAGRVQEAAAILRLEPLLGAGPGSYREASSSGWPWAGPWYGGRVYCSSTSRSATSIRVCDWKCAARCTCYGAKSTSQYCM